MYHRPDDADVVQRTCTLDTAEPKRLIFEARTRFPLFLGTKKTRLMPSLLHVLEEKYVVNWTYLEKFNSFFRHIRLQY